MLRFLQASDLHLGGRAWPGSFTLAGEAAATRQRELAEVPARLATLAREEQVEAVFLPGDCFDRETAPPEIVNAFIEALATIAPVPVFLTPGNHDAAGPASPYAAGDRLQFRDWPENVVLFRAYDFTTVPHPLRSDVSVTGHAFRGNSTILERRLAERLPRGETPLTILCLHGSLLESAPSEEKITLPFLREELLAQDFHYTALGHYHTCRLVRDAAGRIRAAYGGRPFAAELGPPPGDDTAGACLIGTITPSGAEIERRVPLDDRRAFAVEVVCEDVAHEGALRQTTLAALAAAGGTPRDLVRFRLRGTHTPGWTPRLAVPDEACFATAVDLGGLRPGYDLEALRAAADSEAASVESLFVRRMDEHLAAAPNPETRAVLEDALVYGLDALHGLPLEARDAD